METMTICVYGAASEKIDPAFIEGSEQLGRGIARRGHRMVYGGGGGGVMGACARGAARAGGEVTGVVPYFMDDFEVINKNCTKIIRTDTMSERKDIMENSADAFIIAPGGIGTFEEFFEILTLKQLGRHNKPIAVLNVDGYYDDMIRMLETTVREGFMREACLRLYGVFSEPEALLSYLESDQATALDVRHLKNI